MDIARNVIERKLIAAFSAADEFVIEALLASEHVTRNNDKLRMLRDQQDVLTQRIGKFLRMLGQQSVTREQMQEARRLAEREREARLEVIRDRKRREAKRKSTALLFGNKQ